MVALNSINGVPATADSWLLKDLLRDKWKFKGITISDHGAIKELIKHGVASDPQEAVRIALKSGVDMSMSDEYYSKYLPALVKSGAVTMAEIDDAARHVLNVKYDMGLFNDPYSHLGPKESDPQDTNAESRLHRAEARDVARKSIVLLKNRLETLPLKKSGTIAMIGPLADSQRDIMGSWSAAGVAKQSVSLLQGMRNATEGKATLLYEKGANVTDNKGIQDFLNLYEQAVSVDTRSPQQLIDDAVAKAKQADVVVAAVGEAQGMAHEASSRSDLVIPPSQQKLLAALKATGKPLVIVLMNGRPLSVVNEDRMADAMLETWFSGTEGGNAIADVLFGDYNPSGKLPVSFPRSVGQIPIYYNHLPTGRPYNFAKPNKYTSHYYDAANGPLYPFGYGLSYTTFTVSPVKMSSPTMPRNGSIEASVTVTNSGKRDGATVVQMYLNDPVASISRPVQELRGFKRIMLKAGESQTVTFKIDVDALKFWNQQMQHVAEPGKFNVMIGLDSVRTEDGQFNYL
jgi:beta-glucosidase